MLGPSKAIQVVEKGVRGQKEQDLRHRQLPILFDFQVLMAWSSFLALLALTSRGFTQSPADILGAELDAPMLGGGIRTGPGAMLRFGCSQVVIERLDPFVSNTS